MNPNGRTRRRLYTALWVLVWVLLLASIARVLNPMLLPGSWRQMSNHRDYVLVPHSGLYGPMDVRRIGYGYGSPWLPWHAPQNPDRGWIKMNPQQLGGRFITDLFYYTRPPSCSYAITEFTNGGAKQTMLPGGGGTLDQKTLLTWLNRLGIDTTRADVQGETADLLVLITTPDFAPAHQPTLTHFTITSITGGPQWVPAVEGRALLNALWVLPGLIGAIVILRVAARRAVRTARGFSVEVASPPSSGPQRPQGERVPPGPPP